MLIFYGNDVEWTIKYSWTWTLLLNLGSEENAY